MQNVILTVHLIIALFLIGAVLLQRSEGGALFGSSGGGFVTNRGAATALSKATWGLAAAFIATSLALTVLAARDAGDRSVIDRIGTGTPAPLPGPASPLPPATDSLPAAPLAPLAPPPAR